MPSESLVPYAVTVHHYADPKAEPILGSYNTEEPHPDGRDLLETLENIFAELKGEEQVFEDRETTLELRTYSQVDDEADTGRILDGFVRQGSWGDREDIEDPDSGDTFERMRSHVGKTLFYFYMHLPADAKTGLLLTQKTGNRGIKTLFWYDIVAAQFKAHEGGDFRLDIDPVKPGDVYRAFEEGEGTLRGFRLIKHSLPRRITHQQTVPEEWTDQGELEIRVSGKRGVQHLPWVQHLLEMLRGEHDTDSALRLRLSDRIRDDNGDDYSELTMDEIKLDVEVWGKPTTVLVSNEAARPSRFSYPIDIEYDQDSEWALRSDLREEARRVESLLKGHFGWA